MHSNDLAAITVGVRLMHHIPRGWVPVTISGVTPSRYAYQYDATGVVSSCTARDMRRPSRFRFPTPEEMGATVEATPLRVRNVEPRPGLVRVPPPAPPPLAVNGEGSTIELGGKSLAVHVFAGRPCVIAADLGKLLEYGDDGKDLAAVVRKQWTGEMVSGRDFEVLSGPALRKFKGIAALTEGSSVSPNTRDLMVVYERGVDIISQKTEKPVGATLRAYLADEVLPKLRRGEAPTPVAAPAAPLPPASPVEAKLDKLLDAFGALMTALPAMLGARLAPALPPPAPVDLIPVDWNHAGTVAAILSDRLGTKITDARVHKLVREQTDFRGRRDMVRQRSVVSFGEGGVRKEVPQYWHAPAVTEELHRLLQLPDDGTFEGEFRPVDGGKVGEPVSIKGNGRPE